MAIHSFLGQGLHGMGRMGLHTPLYTSIELIYAILIVSICIIIFFKTKELYTLSGHKGINYFRQTFLFFALAFFFRLIPSLFTLSDLPLREFRIAFQLGYFLFVYASSMAILSLMRSISWKKLRFSLLKNSYFYHAIALVLAGLVFISHNRLLLFLSQAILILLTFFISYIIHANQKRRKSMYYTYLLLQIFWMLNIAIVSVPRFMTTIIYILYALSVALFVLILHKVMKRRS